MLKQISKAELNTYLDYAYNLALDFKSSSYPSYNDGIKTKSDFVNKAHKSMDDDNSEILLFTLNDSVLGYIDYYVLMDDKYIGFSVFNVEKHVSIAIKEVVHYLSKEYNNYELNFSFPDENVKAIETLSKMNFTKCENYVNILLLDDYTYQNEDANIIKVDKHNYKDFKSLHDLNADMYWNSDRLFDEIENDKWNLYLYYKGDIPVATIYFIYTPTLMEVFGLDFIDNILNEKVFTSLVIKAVNDTKNYGLKHSVIFTEKAVETELLDKLHFKCIGKCLTFSKKLN